MKVILACVLMLASGFVFAQNIETTVTITGIQADGTAVLVALFDSEQNLKKNKPAATLTFNGSADSASATVNLPEGDYYVTAYQDLNGNDKLDTRLLGIPKEPVGIANYDGKGIPGGFDKHKLRIDAANRAVTVALHKI